MARYVYFQVAFYVQLAIIFLYITTTAYTAYLEFETLNTERLKN